MATKDFNDTLSYAKTTATTRGGMSFDLLCRGDVPYYVCDEECLVHITHEDILHTAVKKLVKKIEDIFTDLQIQKDAKVDKFYIGKTYIQTWTGRKMNPLNPNTWTKKGISSRWGDHKEEDYGRDGMIVIAVITRDQVPLRETEPAVNQEDYTLALEQRLMHYYKITKGDKRLANKTFTSGGADKKGSAGYALYVAFSLKKNETEETEGEVTDDHTGDDSTDLQVLDKPQQPEVNYPQDETTTCGMLSKPDDQNEEGCVAERSVMTSGNETSSMEELNESSFILQPPVSTETGRQHKKQSNRQLALNRKSCHRSQTIIQQVSNSSNTTTSTMNELKTNLVEDGNDIIFLGQSTIQSLTNTCQQHLSQNTAAQHSHTHKLGVAQHSHTHTLGAAHHRHTHKLGAIQHRHAHKLGAAQLSHTHTLEADCTSSSYSKILPTKRRLSLKLRKSKAKVLYMESKPS